MGLIKTGFGDTKHFETLGVLARNDKRISTKKYFYGVPEPPFLVETAHCVESDYLQAQLFSKRKSSYRWHGFHRWEVAGKGLFSRSLGTHNVKPFTRR
jgi:hypothetical protein